MDKLTDKQQKFVEEYLIDLNATQAAIRAGYSENSANEIGCQNLAKLNIAKAVQKAFNERSKRTEITQDYVLETIKDTVEKSRQIEPLIIEKDGEKVSIDNLYNANAVLKGCELLGKHLKLFTDKVEHSGGLSFSDGLKKVSDAIKTNPDIKEQLESEISD